MSTNLQRKGPLTTLSFFSHPQKWAQKGPWAPYRGDLTTVPRALRTPAFLGMKPLVLSGFLVLYAKGISPKHVFIFKLGFFLKFGFTSRHHSHNIHVRMNTCSNPNDLNRKAMLPWKLWGQFLAEKNIYWILPFHRGKAQSQLGLLQPALHSSNSKIQKDAF